MSSLKERTRPGLFDFCAEEFRDPDTGRWGAWHEKYADTCVRACGGLGVVSVWEFGVYLEIIGWDFIKKSGYFQKGLYEYSRPLGDGLDPDGDLTAVVSRTCKLVEGGMVDAHPEASVQRMVDLSEEVEASVEPGNAKSLESLKRLAYVFHSLKLSFEGDSWWWCFSL
ncbi:hypothetical protein R3P38DRAFT_3174816 [Favolaschia claudopus]|uniref:Uncharacterized protein n=1 Tax=Favolaschia claudopus TaxID=2862362 RepID=A0AAW0D7P7_9AGAR